jgi:hypothetical protein
MKTRFVANFSTLDTLLNFKNYITRDYKSCVSRFYLYTQTFNNYLSFCYFSYTGVNLSLDKPGFSGKIKVGFFNIVRIFDSNSKFKYFSIRGNNIKTSNFNKVDIVSVATYPYVENLKDIILK